MKDTTKVRKADLHVIMHTVTGALLTDENGQILLFPTKPKAEKVCKKLKPIEKAVVIKVVSFRINDEEFKMAQLKT